MARSGVKFTFIIKPRLKYKSHNYIYILHLTNDRLPLLKNSWTVTVISRVYLKKKHYLCT